MPEKEKIIYSMSPTTTGGRLIRELTISKMKFLPIKLFITNIEDTYIEIIDDKMVANTET